MTRIMRCPVFAVILLALLLRPAVAQAQQKWPGVIAPGRTIDRTSAGLTATLPDNETVPNPWTAAMRSTVCATLTTSSFPGMSSTNPFADSTVNREDQ